jgi:PEGA domain
MQRTTQCHSNTAFIYIDGAELELLALVLLRPGSGFSQFHPTLFGDTRVHSINKPVRPGGPPMQTRLWLVIVVFFSCVALAASNPRIFVTDSQSWEMKGGVGGTSDGFGGSSGGGARPQTAEIIKTFNQRCPNVIVNNKREKADYVVLLDHEGGKDVIGRDNKIAIFAEPSGDAIFSRSTRSLGNSVKDGCAAIFRDWSRREAAAISGKSVDGSESLSADAVNVGAAKMQVTSTPAAADIEIDGAFVGSTPSTIQLQPGKHQVVVRKNGFARWERTVQVSGGDINLTAELMKAE